MSQRTTLPVAAHKLKVTAPYPEQKAFVRTFIGRYTGYPDSSDHRSQAQYLSNQCLRRRRQK